MVIEKFLANFLWFAYSRKKKKFCRKENLLIRSPNHFHYHFFPCHYQWYLNMKKKNHTFFLSLTLSKNAKYDLRKKNIKIIFLYIYTTHLTFFQNSSFFKKRIWFSIFNINMQVGKKARVDLAMKKTKKNFHFSSFKYLYYYFFNIV